MEESLFFSLLGTAAWCVMAYMMQRQISWLRRRWHAAERMASANIDLYRAESNVGITLLLAVADLRARLLEIKPDYELPPFPKTGDEMAAAIDRVQRLMFYEVFDL